MKEPPYLCFCPLHSRGAPENTEGGEEKQGENILSGLFVFRDTAGKKAPCVCF